MKYNWALVLLFLPSLGCTRQPNLATAAQEALDRGNQAFARKQYDQAIADYSEAIRIDPEGAAAYNNRAVAYSHKKEYDQAIRDYSTILRIDPEHAGAYTGLAWLLATCPKDGLRDGKRAIELATKGHALSPWKYGWEFEALAAANAESGNFKEAVKWARKAIELGFDDNEDAEKARQRLRLYEAGKAYRDNQ